MFIDLIFTFLEGSIFRYFVYIVLAFLSFFALDELEVLQEEGWISLKAYASLSGVCIFVVAIALGGLLIEFVAVLLALCYKL